MTWTRLVYGTAVIAAIAGGTAIYWTTRPTVKPIDMIELVEAAHERMMPFAYTLSTNTLIYEQPQWTVDSSTNRWQLGTNLYQYLVYAGVSTVTDRFVNISTVAGSDTETMTWDLWMPGDIPAAGNLIDGAAHWEGELVTTGRTIAVDWMGETNEAPALVLEVHPIGVGVRIEAETLAHVDAAINAVLTNYVDHEAAVGGVFTQATIPMLTRSSVWARLSLPSVWTNITQTGTNLVAPWAYTNADGSVSNYSGTNLAWVASTNITTNLTFTSGPRITTNMLWERFQVLKYLRWTAGGTNGWTNSVMVAETNESWAVTNDIQSGSQYLGFYDDDHRPGLVTPEWPAWWNLDATNGPPGNWYTPTNGPLIDDALTGSGATNASTGGPRKTFAAAGLFDKIRSAVAARYGGEPGWAYYYSDALTQWGTNWISERSASPTLPLPYNIGGVTVTGDLYVAVSGVTNIPSMRIGSYDMTATNAVTWVGPLLAPTNDIFAATNYPMAGGWNSLYESQYVVGDLWTYDPFGYFEFRAGTWGMSWLVSASWSLSPKATVLKWRFSRCPPD
jgi:hypothetical protein